MEKVKSEKKFNCYTCEYRGRVPGSAHICCEHPSVKKDKTPMGEIMAIFGSVGRVPPHSQSGGELNIKGHPHGISSGWFNHPYNFDPTWLVNCDGYKQKPTNPADSKKGE